MNVKNVQKECQMLAFPFRPYLVSVATYIQRVASSLQNAAILKYLYHYIIAISVALLHAL